MSHLENQRVQMRFLSLSRSFAFLCVSCLFAKAIWAADALTVDANANAVFMKPVSAPNIPIYTTSGSITAAVSLPSDGTTAGKFYKISGTAADYIIALPSAASIAPGAVISFSVAPFGLAPNFIATKQYMVIPTGGQNIDGRPAGFVLVHTNFLTLMSDGVSGWISTVKKVDTDWVDAGPITITATGSPPGKPAATNFDKLWWRREGDSVHVRMAYFQALPGSRGSGEYLFQVPFSIDSTKVLLDNSVTAPLGVGSFQANLNYTGGLGQVVPYDVNHVRAWAGSLADSQFKRISSDWYAMLQVELSYSADFIVPVLNW